MFRFRSTIVAALALAVVAGAAGAQQPTPPRDSTAKAADARHGGRQHGRRHAQRAGKGAKAGRGLERGALRGVTLTDAQQTQLATLREKYKAEAQPIATRLRPALREAHAARQRGDTAAARAAFARTEQDRAALKTLRERQRGEMLAVLTPEQRSTVEANATRMKEKGAARRERRGR